eukprot:s2170_g6.t1
MVGKPPQPANADIAEMEHKSETASKVRARTGEEPEELERKVRVSRNVEEHELENVLRSLPQHGEKMKELLLQLFNLEDPETAAHLPYRDWCEHCFAWYLNATDVQTGYSMAVVLPSKGSVEKYAVAELRKFVFAIGRTFGIVQYDKEAPLKTMARDLCKVVGGMSMRSAPTGHSQSQGSVGNAQRTLYGQLRTLLSQVEVSTGVKVSSESPLFTWSVKHAQWLINRYMIGADGKTAYSRRWNREYNGSLCMFGELIDAKDTEADEVVLGNANGVFKVRTVERRSPSQQWNASYVIQMTSTPWQPRGDGVESTAFVMPPDLGVKGRVRPPPGLERVEEEAEGNVELEDMVPGQSESVTEQDLLLQDGNDRAPAEMDHEAPEATGESPRKSARIDPDAPATEPSTKQMRISAVHHVIAGVIPACKWLASIVGVDEVVGKDGTKIDVDVAMGPDERIDVAASAGPLQLT